MRTQLVTDAIEMAVATHGGQVHGVVFHTDGAGQYASAAFAEVCRRNRIRRRMGRVGSSYDCQSLRTGSRKDRVAPAEAV